MPAAEVVVVTPASVVVVVPSGDEVVVEAVIVVVVPAVTVVVVALLCLSGNHTGSLTGVKKTMRSAKATRQPKAMPSALPLC